MNASKNKNTGIYLLLLLVPLFWGGAFGAAQHVMTEIPPLTAAALRFGLAALLLILLTTLQGKWDFQLMKGRWIGLLLMGIIGIFLYNAFFFIGLNHTTAINGSLIMGTSPVILTLGAVLFLGERWDKRFGFGLLLSLIGVLFVIMKGSLETLLSLSFNAGDLIFIGALLSWGTYGLIGKVVMKGVSPLLTTTVTMTIGSIFLGICSLVEGGWQYVPSMSAQAWFEMIYMVVLASFVAFFIWNKGISQIGASKTGLYMNLVPINASWIAVVLYGETMTWPQFIGMALVITGVYIGTSGGRNKKAKQRVRHKPGHSTEV